MLKLAEKQASKFQRFQRELKSFALTDQPREPFKPFAHRPSVRVDASVEIPTSNRIV